MSVTRHSLLIHLLLCSYSGPPSHTRFGFRPLA